MNMQNVRHHLLLLSISFFCSAQTSKRAEPCPILAIAHSNSPKSPIDKKIKNNYPNLDDEEIYDIEECSNTARYLIIMNTDDTLIPNLDQMHTHLTSLTVKYKNRVQKLHERESYLKAGWPHLTNKDIKDALDQDIKAIHLVQKNINYFKGIFYPLMKFNDQPT